MLKKRLKINQLKVGYEKKMHYFLKFIIMKNILFIIYTKCNNYRQNAHIPADSR